MLANQTQKQLNRQVMPQQTWSHAVNSYLRKKYSTGVVCVGARDDIFCCCNTADNNNNNNNEEIEYAKFPWSPWLKEPRTGATRTLTWIARIHSHTG